MATITVQDVTAAAGTAVTFASAAGGGDVINTPGERVYLLVRNADASSKTVTIAVPGTLWNGQAAPDTAVTVSAGTTKAIPLGANYLDSNGQASVTYSDVTSTTIAAVRM